MSNNVIKDNTMIDNECKELTGIEIENLDIDIDTINEDDEYYNTNDIVVDDNENLHYEEERLEDTF